MAQSYEERCRVRREGMRRAAANRTVEEWEARRAVRRALYTKKVRPTPADRFTGRYEIQESGCWHWLGHLNADGYGHFHIGGVYTTAHRASYIIHVGLIPDGFHVDHLCRNPRCVNPAHLEAVTPRENILRGVGRSAQNAKKVRCPRCDGDYSFDKNGGRFCRPCARASNSIWQRTVRLARLREQTKARQLGRALEAAK